ncbi:hypothetical protein KIN20_023661 [Parelaphostrongylus tenuis]|uniref:Uncharacterized protein n=1 Tax=Parelaphostrongylus tenuis TaxID=148309 RepID=A0AAD5N9A7_PARTN|nr:hypothetical protein KIN20_023661 [Parelaphostrongylus tenuis]
MPEEKLNLQKCPKDFYPTNTCEYKCQDNYTISYDEDKHYGRQDFVEFCSTRLVTISVDMQ